MEVDIRLQPPHAGQLALWHQRTKQNAVRCGRRWGKTQFAVSLITQKSAKGLPWGLFAPDYKILSETYRDLEHVLRPMIESSSKTEGLIRLITGGRIDFWTLNNPKAGRSRKYAGIVLDEVAFAGPDMAELWDKAISPTLLDYQGEAWALSTPNGINPDNWFYRICTDKTLGWQEFHAPTSTNPFLAQDAVAKLKDKYPPLVYQQEYLAEFVDWNGAAFFSETSMLVNGEGVDYPTKTDQVFAVIDTALKDGLEHDGTAVLYCARNKIIGHPLIILDYDILQIEGMLLETWLPGVQMRLDDLAKQTSARQGSVGMWIEDKASGIVLLQQAQRKGLPAYPIDGDLTAMGKDGRALSVSAYVYRGDVKLSKHAHNKIVNFKGQSKNHLLSQVCGYRMGVKTPHQMDLLDTFCYSVAISLGDSEGY